MARELIKGLNERQTLFCEHYLTNGLNATQAALDAGYSPKTVGSISSRLLQDVKIKAFLDSKREKAAKKFDITHEKITEKLAQIAFSGMGQVVYQDPNGNPALREDADFDMLDNISFSKSSSSNQFGGSEAKSFSMKRSDRLKALDMLSKHLGYYDGNVSSDKGDRKLKSNRVLEALRGLRKKVEKVQGE